MAHWWERCPERYQFELAELERLDYEYRRDENAWNAGRLELAVTYPLGDAKLGLRAFFPDTYPFFPPSVTAPNAAFPLHQDPVSKLLCLLPEDSSAWSPRSDSLASLLSEQMPKLLRSAAEGAGADAANALPDAEPMAAFLTYEAASHLGVGDWTMPEDVTSGKLLIGFDRLAPVRGAVLLVSDHGNRELGRADVQLASRYADRPRLYARWGRLDAPPLGTTADNLYRELLRLHPDLSTPLWLSIRDDDTARIQVEILAALFREEQVRGDISDNWLFVARKSTRPPRHRHRRNAGRASIRPKTEVTLVRTGRESMETLRARIPELRPLADKKIVLFGAGSVGSVCAVELARAGVKELAILDSDHLEVANSVRWVVGRNYAGLSKVQALREHIEREYPHTSVSQFPYRLGQPHIPSPGDPNAKVSELEILDQMLGGAALVLDATAQFSVGHLLSVICRERGIPHVWVSTTPGAWGGLIGRSVPGKTAGCWRCSKHFQNREELPSPRADPNGDRAVHPAGCFHPTFTGAALDINQVALAAVRVVASVICAGSDGGYPEMSWDFAVVNYRAEDGQAIPPEWSTSELLKHPDCDHS